MDIQNYADFYKQFLHKNYILTAGKNKRTITIKISFGAEHFFHLIGLQKLVDLPDMAAYNNKYVFFKNALRGNYKMSQLEKSLYFLEVKQRLDCLEHIPSLLNQNLVIRFDNRKAYSSINAQILLYKNYMDNYIHLFFKPSPKDIFAPVSLFATRENNYIIHQEVYTVLDLQIEKYDTKKNSTDSNLL